MIIGGTMKKIITVLFAALTLTSPISALLPPYYQSVAEIKMILEDKTLADKLGSGEQIILIKKIREGYLVLTTRQKVKVDVVFEKQEMPGPAKFHLVVHDAVAKD